jgi:hypothetical protein
VTVIRKIFAACFKTQIPHCFVGDLPKALLHMDWMLKMVDTPKPGDLIFCYSARKQRISHVAIAISEDKIFHCAYRVNCVIESVVVFLKRVDSPLKSLDELRDAEDPREYLQMARSLQLFNHIEYD